MVISSSFDNLFDQKVGQGSYQRVAYFFMGLIALADEAELISLSVILPAIKQEWNLSKNQVSLLGSVLFFGIFLGSVFIGLVSDRLGRRTALLIASSLQFIFGLGSCMVTSFEMFLVIRSVLGFMIGCTVPIAPTFITEISTTAYRGKGQVFIQAFFVFGMLYAMLLSKIFLGSFTDGNWRGMLAMGALPALIVFLGTLKYIKESPRFLVAKGKIEQGISVLNYMGAKNNKNNFQLITIDERVELTNWQQSLFFSQTDKVGWTSLFTQENRRITFCLIVNWFGLSFNFFGMVFILPVILGSLESNNAEGSGKSIDGFFLTMLGEIPAIIIAYFIIDRQAFGRKNSTLYSHLFAAIMFGVAFFGGVDLLLLSMVIARIFTKMAFITINPLTSELYPTSIRTIAMGLTSGIGRLGASIMPVVSMELFNVRTFAPFLGFSVVCLIMVVATYYIPFEPLGRQLDRIAKNPEDELKEKDRSFGDYKTEQEDC